MNLLTMVCANIGLTLTKLRIINILVTVDMTCEKKSILLEIPFFLFV